MTGGTEGGGRYVRFGASSPRGKRAADPYAISDRIYTPPAGQPMFNPQNLLSIQFHVPTNTSGPVLVMNLMCVNNLTAVLGG
jgi:hypothetical protein